MYLFHKQFRVGIIGSVVAVCLVAAIGYGISRHQPQPQLPVTAIQIGKYELLVELATTAEQQARGLMFRQSLAPYAGMLFVFGEAQPLSFWMKNTSIPLSIAFLDDGDHILSLASMQPYDRTWHYLPGPARYALEVD